MKVIELMKNQNFNPQNDPLKQKQDPISSGPQFNTEPEQTSGWRNWIRKYGSSVILPIIALLILAGGIYLYSTQKSEQKGVVLEEESDQEEMINEEEILDMIEQEEESKGATEETEITDSDEIIEESEREIIPEDEVIISKAGTGDGITHLARHSLKEYLKENPQELTNEHKVFIEDYLKDQIGSRPLEVGEEISFSKNTIQEAIDASNQLTESQLDNLKQYSEQINWD